MLTLYEPREFAARFLQRSGALELSPEIEASVRTIVDDVRRRGDEALFDYTERFDGVRLTPDTMPVSGADLRRAADGLDTELRNALELAIANLREFHAQESLSGWERRRPDGTVIGQRIQAMDSAGLYVPGGRAPYPSSLLMNAVPAQIAGVEELVVCTPPGPSGEVHPLILAAASLVGIRHVFRVGGAQAIAALAYGTETVPGVDKVVGPGNIYVAVAKRLVFGAVDIDSMAGPSELAVVADTTAVPELVAADLLAQAEHDPEARVYLFCTARRVYDAVAEALRQQLPGLEREDIINQALEKWAGAVVAPPDTLWRLVNDLAPEHLSLQVESADAALDRVRHAGAVFVGPLSAVSFGDYTAGPNHVLPTGRTARFSSPLGVFSFVKRTNVLRLSETGLRALVGATERLARAEGLTAHARAATLRVQDSPGGTPL